MKKISTTKQKEYYFCVTVSVFDLNLVNSTYTRLKDDTDLCVAPMDQQKRKNKKKTEQQLYSISHL